MLKLALPELRKLSPTDEGQNDIGREAFFDCGFDSERVRGVEKDAGMLRSNNRFNDGREVVNIGKSLHAEDDVIERTISISCGIFWVSDNYEQGERV